MDRGSDSDETFTSSLVRLSLATPASSYEMPDPFAGLWSAVIQTIDGRDLDAYVAVLILKSSGSRSDLTLELLSRKLADGASFDSPLSKSKDVAIMGALLALSMPAANTEHFCLAARRESARRPLPPAACIHDDERLLIGISAGIGKVCPAISPDLIRALRSHPQPRSVRQRCVDLWAESLCCGEARFSMKLAQRGAELLRGSLKASTITPEDHVLLCWLAGRLLESEWSPGHEELETVLEFIEGQAYSLRGLIALLGTVTPVDAAFLLSLQSIPMLKTVKRGISLVLDVINGFPAAASVLSKRQRGRTPFIIEDEYDLQDLFHAMVVPLISDLTPEDPASKVAGKSSRLDFISRSCRLGVELKHVKSKRHANEVREEILVDQGTYFQHPAVDSVVTFVFDPGSFIPPDQRPSFEADLSRSVAISDRTINHVVRVR
jgi:hypothetical protein